MRHIFAFCRRRAEGWPHGHPDGGPPTGEHGVKYPGENRYHGPMMYLCKFTEKFCLSWLYPRINGRYIPKMEPIFVPPWHYDSANIGTIMAVPWRYHGTMTDPTP